MAATCAGTGPDSAKSMISAFIAAGDNLKLKAEIADSLKGRPALHFAQFEMMAESDEDLKARIEAEEAGLQDLYITNFRERSESKGNWKQQAAWPEPPEGWIAVHFYLGRWPDLKGYAVIYDSVTGDWALRTFDYGKLWSAYLAWQWQYGDCSHLRIDEQQRRMAPIVETLCTEIE